MSEETEMTIAERGLHEAIRRAKAKAWAEGYEAGSTDSSNFEDVRDGYAYYDDHEETPNPYQEDE